MPAVIRAAAVGALLAATAACTSKVEAPGKMPPPPSVNSVTVTPAAPLMKPVVSVKELMRFDIDPASDFIFDAVQYDATLKGARDIYPKTDEDWEKVKIGAVSLAENVYLLKIKRPWTPKGDVNNSTGPKPPELSPEQIQAKYDKDPVLWDAKIEALRNAALEVMEVADKRDAKALFEASADVDMACENCHLEYWYPGDRAAVEDDKRQRARIDPAAKRKKR